MNEWGIDNRWFYDFSKNQYATTIVWPFQAMREDLGSHTYRGELWNDRQIMLSKPEDPINSPIWLGQISRLWVATAVLKVIPKQ